MLSRKYRTRLAREERATGEGEEELTEKEALLEELMEIDKETEIQIGEEMVLRKETAKIEKEWDWKSEKEQWNVMMSYKRGFLSTWEKRKNHKKEGR